MRYFISSKRSLVFLPSLSALRYLSMKPDAFCSVEKGSTPPLSLWAHGFMSVHSGVLLVWDIPCSLRLFPIFYFLTSETLADIVWLSFLSSELKKCSVTYPRK